jgi:uncharacterized protein (DUF1800 family)
MPTQDLALRLLAGTTYTAASYRDTKIPTRAELHLMNRMGCGYSRTTWGQLRRAGGGAAWFEKQLRPGSVTENAKAAGLIDWFPDLRQSPVTKWERNVAKTKGGWEYARDLANYTTMRRIYSNRQVLETMTDFWSNHLHVPANGDLSWPLRYSYDATIRKHALGRFEDLLVACTLHPAMLIFLDNWKSTRGAPNENHGRELLELHTVGRTSGYTEAMVKDSAKILSGYTVDAMKTWAGFYDTGRHATGPVQVLGFTDANDAADGAQLTVRYLKYLANHPATARMVARRLAVRFVSDTPSDGLVDHLADVFTTSGTDIAATLRALVATEEFQGSFGQKVRTPIDDLVATCRVMKISAQKPERAKSFAHVVCWMPRSLLLFQWPRPDGPPETNPDWASVSRMLASFRMHWNLGAGYYPTVDVRYPSYRSWLPQRRIRLDKYVDHLCRMLLGRRSTSRDLQAVCQATGLRPGEVVTKNHALARWMFVRLAAVLLDSPDHLSR